MEHHANAHSNLASASWPCYEELAGDYGQPETAEYFQ